MGCGSPADQGGGIGGTTIRAYAKESRDDGRRVSVCLLFDRRRTGGTGEWGNGRTGELGNWGKGRTRVTKPGLVQKNKHITYRLAVGAASAVGVVERDSLDDTGDRSGGRPSTNPRLLICWLGDGFNECPMDGASTGFIAGVVEARRAR